MNAYYFPVNKDIFVQKSFDLTKAEADNQIAVLTGIAKEVDNKSVSTQSKMILQEMGLLVKFLMRKRLPAASNLKTTGVPAVTDFVMTFIFFHLFQIQLSF